MGETYMAHVTLEIYERNNTGSPGELIQRRYITPSSAYAAVSPTYALMTVVLNLNAKGPHYLNSRQDY
jgi:hypothetical protein